MTNTDNKNTMATLWMLTRLAVVAVVIASSWLVASRPVLAQQQGIVTLGNARFTVITPELIRLEYSASNGFIDQPSQFAINRSTRDATAVINAASDKVTVETSVLLLTYVPNGHPFSAANLSVAIKTAQTSILWHPGDPNAGNLGGTVRSLDGWDGARDLGQGVISRDGWY